MKMKSSFLADPYGKGWTVKKIVDGAGPTVHYSDDAYIHERNQLAIRETNPPEIPHEDFDPLTSSE
jgi:hypothetical protein